MEPPALESACYNWRVPPPVSGEVHAIVRSLFEERSLADHLRGRDHRPACLAQLAASREIRVVPDLLPLLAADDALTPDAARTVAALLRDVTPTQLAWIDERARTGSDWHAWRNTWRELRPGTVSRLAHAATLETAAIGLLASHRNGFVRAAAIEALGQRVDGQELVFLSLRANDWVDVVAARARQLLLDRLRPDNRHAVLAALPFIVRVVGQRRRDHRDLERALESVLLADGGDEVLARVSAFGPTVRRLAYERLLRAGSASVSRIVDAAVGESDGVIRTNALRALAATAAFDRHAATLERLLRDDPLPSIRRLSLTLLAERNPGRVAGLFPEVLLDRAACVRDVARFVARTHQLPVVVRDIYVRGLTSAGPRHVTAAIAGVGEVGAREDATLLTPHLGSPVPRNRRAALRALARLDPEGAAGPAIAALADDATSVRSAAVAILSARETHVDLAFVSEGRRSLPPCVRLDLLRVIARAPKWVAAAGLLEAVGDEDDVVRAAAVRSVDRWLDAFNRSQAKPSAAQRARIATVFEEAAPHLSARTAAGLRFVLERA